MNPKMNLIDELAKLDQLHKSGSLTSDEFQLAKSRILNSEELPVNNDSISDDLHTDDLHIANLLSQLDREWEIERERYMIMGKYGQKFIPDRTTSLVGAVVIATFGVLWTCVAIGMGFVGGGILGSNILLRLVSVIFPLFGILFTAFAVYMGLNGVKKAEAYEKAQTQYRSRRRAILACDLRAGDLR